MQDRGPLALTSFLFRFRFSPFSDTLLRAYILQNIAHMCLLVCVLQHLPALTLYGLRLQCTVGQ